MQQLKPHAKRPHVRVVLSSERRGLMPRLMVVRGGVTKRLPISRAVARELLSAGWKIGK